MNFDTKGARMKAAGAATRLEADGDLRDQNVADCGDDEPAGCTLGYGIRDIRCYPPVEPPARQ